MKVKEVPIEESVGHILVHNQAGADGRRILRKGTVLTEADLPKLRSLGRESLYVAILSDDDINEDEAARRLGNLITGHGVQTSRATTGRVNLVAETNGVFKVDIKALADLNDHDGVTLATVPNNSLVESSKMLGTIKIIPYSVPRTVLEAAELVVRENSPLVEVKPFVVRQAALITTGSDEACEKVVNSFTPALRERLAAYDVTLIEGPYVAEDEQQISQALQQALASGAGMILVAGETSIMDADDITPRAIKSAGGEVVHHGVPVEPGNLLMLAYHQETPIVGAPGCARSKSYNVIDMVLPRLAAGEKLTRRDLIEMGHGGYLK